LRLIPYEVSTAEQDTTTTAVASPAAVVVFAVVNITVDRTAVVAINITVDRTAAAAVNITVDRTAAAAVDRSGLRTLMRIRSHYESASPPIMAPNVGRLW
jgi:hypothetical protein